MGKQIKFRRTVTGIDPQCLAHFPFELQILFDSRVLNPLVSDVASVFRDQPALICIYDVLLCPGKHPSGHTAVCTVYPVLRIFIQQLLLV